MMSRAIFPSLRQLGLMFAFLLGSLLQAEAQNLTWTNQFTGNSHDLREVWGTDASNVWAVGTSGTILRYNGTSWTAVLAATEANLSGVWGTSATNVWAVGDGGTIQRFDGAGWTLVASDTTADLKAVWGADASNVWAVGLNGAMVKFDGTSWQAQTSNTSQHLFSVSGTSASNVWAVGGVGTIRRYDGTSWLTQTSGTSHWLFGVWAAGTQAWAVEDNGGSLFFGGSSWEEKLTGGVLQLTGITGTSATNLRAVGDGGRVIKSSDNGNTWTLEDTLGGGVVLHGIWAADAAHWWIVGDSGAIFAGTVPRVPTAVPTVTSTEPTSIGSATAEMGGEVTADGGGDVLERGIVWATTPNPTTAANKVAMGTGLGVFNGTLTGLPPGTGVYARAYATNAFGTGYGVETLFTTLSNDANLLSLSLHAATLSPGFSPANTLYSVSLPGRENASVRASPVKISAPLHYRINGGSYTPLIDGVLSESIPLITGLNTLEVRVTAKDGITQKTYTIIISTSDSVPGTGVGAIPDPGNLDVSFAVSGRSGTVTGVSADFTAVHGNIFDMKVSLIAPDGTALVLIDRIRNTEDLHGVYHFTDSASGKLSATTPDPLPSGSYQPESGSFAESFVGRMPNGTWTLSFTDGFTGGTGMVAGANLTILTPANAAPVITGHGATHSLNFAENSAATVLDLDATDADLPAQTLTWSLGGADEAKFDLNDATGVLSFKPAHTPDFEALADADANGIYEVTLTVTDSFTTPASDAVALSITITDVNEAPSFTKAADITLVATDAPQTRSAWATAIDDGDGTVPQTLSFTITKTSGDNLLTAGPAIDPVTGNLTFTPNGSTGSAAFSVTLTDDTSIGGPGTALTTAAQTFTLSVTPANAAPVIKDLAGDPVPATVAVNLAENAAYSTTLFVTDADIPAQTLTWSKSGPDKDKFTLNPTTGAFSLNGTLDFETRTDADLDSIYEITMTVTDSGTPAASDSVALTLNITDANDAPTISTIADQTTDEDTPITAVPFTVGDQDAGQDLDALVIEVASNNETLIPVANIVISGSGASRTLALTPAANLNGTAMITVTVGDGTASTSRSFTVTVTSVNDAPTFTLAPPITRFPGSGPYTQPGVVSAISPGPNESGQTVTLSLPSVTNPALFTVQPTLSASGSLSFTPGSTPGVSTVTVRAQDDGGAFTEQTFTIAISAFKSGAVGEVWTPRDSDRKWQAITSSADGSKLAAVVYGGQIYTSTDSGVTWMARESNRDWLAITSSADGSKLAAVNDGGQIYTSTDSGVTWTARESDRSWSSITSSADGSKLAAVISRPAVAAGDPGVPGQIYTSTDSGVTWTARDSARAWTSITSSADGSKLAAVVDDGQIYTSTDSGVTWTARESDRNWFSITSSADGSKLAAVVFGGQIYTSTDSGVTWTARESDRNWFSITSSANGSKLAAVVFGGQIYTSTDSGVTWTARESNRGWRSITSSADGSKLAAVNDGGQIYTSEGSGLPEVAAGRAFTVANFTTAEASTGVVSYTVTNNNPALFTVQPAIAPDGTLTLTAGQAAGTATVTGSAIYGGGAATTPQSFPIQVIKRLKIRELFLFTFNDSPSEQYRRIAAGETFVGVFRAALFDNPSGIPLVLSGPDAALFQLDPVTGILEFKTVPSFAGGRVYDFTLSVGSAASVNGMATARIRLTDQDVNLMPSFTKGADLTDVPATVSPRIIPGWATGISDGDAAATQALTFTFRAISGENLLSVPPAIDPATGNLSFTPSGIAGTARYAVTLTDDATINGSPALTTAEQTFDLTFIAPANTAPVLVSTGPFAAMESFNLAENTAVAIPVIGVTDADSGQTHTWALSGADAGMFQLIALTSPAGTYQLAFKTGSTPDFETKTDANGDGIYEVIVTATDSGTPAASDSVALSITITDDNDAPTVSAIGPQSTNEDTPKTIAFTVADQDAGQSVAALVVTATVHVDDTALIPQTAENIVLGGSGASRTLTLTPAADLSGTAEITVSVTDGQAEHHTTSRTFILTVNAVNDAPSFTLPANVTRFPGSGAYTQAGVVSAISPGPADESGQTVTLSLPTITNPTLFTVPPTLAVDGSLSFTPGSAPGVSTLTVRAQDSGGAATEKTFTIAISSLAVTFADVTMNEDSTLAVGPAGFTGSPGPILNKITASSNPTLIPFDANAAAAATVTLTPAANQSGTSTITVASSDEFATVTNTFTVTVNAVNDAPTFTLPAEPAWTARDQPRQWTSITSSADGTKLAATTRSSFFGTVRVDGAIWISNDSGLSWKKENPSDNFSSITSSADGSKLAAAMVSGQIYTSTNSGRSWTARESIRSWQSITSSADGSKLAAVVNGGQIYTSADSGVSWTPQDSNRRWKFITSSAAGNKLAAVVDGGHIYTSTDYGATWMPRMTDADRDWRSITSSADGSKLAAVVFNGQIYTSTDSGATWTARASSDVWETITSSADGNKLAAAYRGKVHASIDSGVTWTEQASSFGGDSITSSADGNKLAAAGGQLSTSEGPRWQNVAALSGTFTQANFATAISPGPADESTQTVSFTVTTDKPGLFSVRPAIAPNGTLTFLPGRDAGNATVTVRAVDTGGTANGGVNFSEKTFTITITKPLKLKEFVFVTTQDMPQRIERSIPEGQSEVLVVTSETYGIDNNLPIRHFSLGEVEHFTLTPTTVSGLGVYQLKFKEKMNFEDLPPGFNGGSTYVVYIQVGEDGSPLGGDQAEIHINVTDVNEMPSFTIVKDATQTRPTTTVPATVAPQIIPGWATGIDDGDSRATQSLNFTFTPVSGAFRLSAGPAIDPATGNLTFTPSGTTGTARYRVKLTDDASINGGAALTTAEQFFDLVFTAGAPEITVTPPASLDFGDVPLGQSVTKEFTVTNDGFAPLTFTPSLLSGPNTGEITLSDPKPQELRQHGLHTTFNLTFKPGTLGAKTVTLRLISNDGDEAQVDFTLTGTATTAPPALTTTTVTQIEQTKASAASSVTNAGGSDITERGFLYAVKTANADPQLLGASVVKVAVEGSLNALSAPLTGLTPGTEYALRAFATNAGGTAYTPVVPFTTLAGAPEIAVFEPAARELAQPQLTGWGENFDGQLNTPTDLPAAVKAVAVGARHTVAVLTDGRVRVWGSGNVLTIPLEAQSGVQAVATSDFHIVVLKTDGSVFAWGNNRSGQCSIPAELTGKIVTAIAAGAYHTLALTSEGKVVAWGLNTYRQSAVPDTAKSDVKAIAAGDAHSLALKQDGTVIGWGDSFLGQIPRGLTGVTGIAAGTGNSLVLKSDGTVLGYELRAAVPAGLGAVKAIASGHVNRAAVKADGSVVVWGDVLYDKTTGGSSLRSVQQVAMGKFHIYALTGTELDFGSQGVGSSSPAKAIKVKNTGTGPLTISGITVTGDHAADFAIASAPSSVAAGSEATFTLTFTPSASGSRSASLEIKSNDSDEATLIVPLTGGSTSANADLASLGVTNSELSPAFDPQVKDYTLRLNAGTSNVTVTPTLAQANATVTVSNTGVGAASKDILIVVTAQDGVSQKTYTLKTALAVTNRAATGAGSLQDVVNGPTNPAPPSTATVNIAVPNAVSVTSVRITFDTAALPAPPAAASESADEDETQPQARFAAASDAPPPTTSAWRVIDASRSRSGFTIAGYPGNQGLIEIAAGSRIKFVNTTFTGGGSTGLMLDGAAIINHGELVLENCTLSYNQAVNGGAIFNSSTGILTLERCTFLNNTATETGGAIHNEGQLTLRHCTFSHNSALTSGGAIHNTGTCQIEDSILAGNYCPTEAASDVSTTGNLTLTGTSILRTLSGTATVTGTRLTSDPLLMPALSIYGEPAVLPLAAFSPAINAATTSTSLLDQHFLPMDGLPDAGASEYQNLTPLIELTTTDLTTNEDTATTPLTFYFTDEDSPAITYELISQDEDLIADTGISVTDAGDGTFDLTFTPKANANGLARILLAAHDGIGTTYEDLLIDIRPVNDRPTLATVPEHNAAANTGPATVPSLLSAEVGGGDDEAQTQGLTYQVIASDPTLFSVQPTVNPVTLALTYTPSGLVGTTTLALIATDDGGTANGGVNTSVPSTLTLRLFGTPVEAWRQTYFGQSDAGGNRSDLLDADFDGVANLLEFAFGLQPTASDNRDLQRTGTFTTGGLVRTGQPIVGIEPTQYSLDYRAVFIRRRDHAAAGLIYTPEFSALLNVWQPSSAIPTVLATSGDYELVTVPYLPFVNGRKAQFFRIRVHVAP
ncbi:MAG: choice-of-anchor D domain-containing protein [Verrucomicrobiaceae bacterium]|nr:choice-of-anchor D domain-containing protein [Verrucomicrobiaceae bacterium]